MNVMCFSPFTTNVQPAPVDESPAAKVKCYGAGLQPSAVRKGQKAVFTVDATQATVSGAPVNVTTTNLNTGSPIYTAGRRKRAALCSTITLTFLVIFTFFDYSKRDLIFYREVISNNSFRGFPSIFTVWLKLVTSNLVHS